jgi:hypothetical protein
MPLESSIDIRKGSCSVILGPACDDSHLPVVQAGNLGTMFLELRRVSKISKGAIGACDALTWPLSPMRISWYAHLRCEVRGTHIPACNKLEDGLASTKK